MIFFLQRTKSYAFARNVTYCDNRQVPENCTPCPPKSRCKLGLVVGCKRGYYLLNKQVCVSKALQNDLLADMYWYTLDLLAENNGHNVCAQTGGG